MTMRERESRIIVAEGNGVKITNIMEYQEAII